MSAEDPTTNEFTERELEEIAALAAAARTIRARRKFLRRTTIAVLWAAPVIETLAVVPDAQAQGMMMTMQPMGMMGMGMGMGMGMA